MSDPFDDRVDDEATRDADPGWLASLREEHLPDGDADRSDDSSDGETDLDERTIGNGDLLDRVRQAVLDARTVQSAGSADPDVGAAGPTVNATSTPAAASAPAVAPSLESTSPTTSRSGSRAMSFPPPDPTSPVHSAKAALTPTFPEARWQPPARLKPVAPGAAPALITAPPTHGHRSKRLIMVGIVGAVVAGVTIGLLVGRSSGDPAPTNDTEVTTASTGDTLGSGGIGTTTPNTITDTSTDTSTPGTELDS